MKVLVTGASGFIGREIVSELAKENFEIKSLVGRLSIHGNQEFAGKIEVFAADITDKEKISRLESIGKIDAIIHSAGLAHQFGETKKEEFEAVNVEGSANIANLAVKLKAEHFILIGSTAIYGVKHGKAKSKSVETLSRSIIDEETEIDPPNFYAESKLEAENVCREICEKNSLPLTIFRLAPVIGEDNVGNVARLIKTIDRGRFIWIGKGENLKTLIYKRDVARACVVLLKNKRSGTEIFNLAGQAISMKDFVGEIARQLDTKIFSFAVPQILPEIAFQINSKIFKVKKISRLGATIEKWLADDIYAADKIYREYGFKPATTIVEALGKQVQRYLEIKENGR